MACYRTSLTVATVPVGTDLQQAHMRLRLFAAAVMGALIGWERGRSDKPADSRTKMLVSVGAACGLGELAVAFAIVFVTRLTP